MRLNLLSQKMSCSYIAAYLIAVFSGAYLTKLGLSPIYPLMGLGMLILGWLVATGKFTLSLLAWLSVTSVGGLLVFFSAHQIAKGSMFQDALNFALGPLAFFFVAVGGRALEVHKLKRIGRNIVYVTIALALVECLYRFTHPDFGFLDGANERNVDIDEVAFYAYKFSSLMYLDSNFVGLQLAIVFAFALALIRYGVKFHWSVYLSLILLTLLTLSRASTVAIVATYAVFVLPRLSRTVRILSVFAGVGIGYAIYLNIQSDGSFLTKLTLLEMLFEYASSASAVELALGVGVGRAAAVLGMGAHNLIVSYVVELGLLFSMAVALGWLYILKRTRGTGLLIVAWVVNGFSLTSFAMPYMYCAAAVLWCLSRQQGLEDKCDDEIVRPGV